MYVHIIQISTSPLVCYYDTLQNLRIKYATDFNVSTEAFQFNLIVLFQAKPINNKQQKRDRET